MKFSFTSIDTKTQANRMLKCVEFGAKWQQKPEQFFNDDRAKTLEKGIEYLLKAQERMYSEEQLKMLMFDFYYDMSHKMNVPKNLISENATNVDEWFKQYKKKC